MILCPNCHHEEFDGALFCSECGAQLITLEGAATQTLASSKTGPVGKVEPETPISAVPPVVNRVDTGAFTPALHLVEGGDIISLSGKSEFTLGRIAEGQPILPDIDLSGYEAYAQGVSRLHAVIKVMKHRVFITDLGSSNGTRVNGQKIMAHTDYPLNHGDLIALGKLKFQVVFENAG